MFERVPPVPPSAMPGGVAEAALPRPARPTPRPVTRLRVGLLNNMPDSAFVQTERQFRDLLGGAAVELFTFAGITRGAAVGAHLDRHYAPHHDLPLAGLDALVVTGCEPRARRLADEPYFRDLAAVVDWARGGTASTLFSCLAAHAAVLHLDGIERRPLPAKLSGVYPCAPVAAHPLLAGMPEAVAVPHSRLNGLDESDLGARGYTVLRRADAVGADLFLRDFGSLFVFLQGHPEYRPDSLAREYRRDVGRYLDGQRPALPALPENYYGPEAAVLFADFSRRAEADRTAMGLDDFPAGPKAAPLPPAWGPDAQRLFRNWLSLVAQRREAALPRPARSAASEMQGALP